MTHTERVQAALAERASGFPLIDGAKPAFWPFGTLTAEQLAQRAAQERAMREGRLARFPEALL